MRRVALGVLFLLSLSTTAFSQTPTEIVPERRLELLREMDLPGGDLQSIFDTSYDLCRNSCLNTRSCQAFTFNAKSNSCFLKGETGEPTPFEGATSARLIETPKAVKDLASTRMGDLAFLSEWEILSAKDTALTISERFSAGDWLVDDLLATGGQEFAAGNSEGALTYYGAALTLTDASDVWVEYARILLVHPGTSTSGVANLKYEAQNAAINAYLRAQNKGAQVTALGVLAEAFEANGRGRDMIPALRLAQSIQPRDDNAELLDRAIGQYGFHINEHTVESDLASPRVCAIFSEELLAAASEYQNYVRLEGVDPVLSVSGSQLCVEGLTHGERYVATFREGLPAANGEKLGKDIELTLYVRDRSPQVWFPGRGYILPASAEVALPITGVNVTNVDVDLYRLSDRNLIRSIQNSYFGLPMDSYTLDYFSVEMGVKVWEGSAELKSEVNQDITTRLPIGEVIGTLEPGIYFLQAAVPGKDQYEYPPAGQWFVVSDIGLTSVSGNDGIHVFVRSLATAEAKAGVPVDLVSESNEVLASVVTDDQGHVLFDAALTRGTGGMEPSVIMAAVGDKDFSFLPLTDPEFDLSDRGVEGRAPAEALDIFVTTDRGAYRAGETVHVTALVRNSDARALAGVPLTAIFMRPDGQEYSRALTTGDVEGGHVFELPIGGSAPRGLWQIYLVSGDDGYTLASASVLVEDFLPQRIDFTVALPEGILPMDPTTLTIDAKYLFGAPGADLAIEGEAILRRMRSIEQFPGYVFGRHDQDMSSSYQFFDGGYVTDEAGHAEVPVALPVIEEVSTPLGLQVNARVLEGSGRPVERSASAMVAPPGPVIGIKSDAEGVFPEGTEAGFSLIALDETLKPTDMKVHWTVSRVEIRYQWYNLYGSWNWDAVTTRTKVAEGDAVLGKDPVHVGARVEWGNYEIKVERTDGPRAVASEEFYAGWYVSADTTSTPDVLELSLNKTSFKPGETAELRLVPRYAGKALVMILSDHLINTVAVDVVEGENIVKLPVTDDWGAGAYVTASVIRPMDVAAGQNPARSLGLSYASVDPGSRQLSASLELPAEAKPRMPLDVAVKVEGVAPGETAYVTLAAVDVGILNLTGFDSPDPSAHYFGQRRLGVALRDVYGRLIDGLAGETGALRSGGDSATEAASDAEPPTEELVAYFQGPLPVGADGYVRTSFDMPSFNGTVRVMAVAWSKSGVGQADAEVIIRDPVVVTASLPRFMAPGDTSRLLLEFTHVEGAAGRMGLDIVADGLALESSPSGFDLAEGGNAKIEVPVVATDTGRYEVAINLTTPDGEVLTKVMNLSVRDLEPPVARTSRFDIDPGETFTLDANVFAGLREGTGTASLAIGPLARLDAPGLLKALDRYPYGCTEQITSRALPLLYLDDVAIAMGLEQADKVNERIEQAITEVLANQNSSGAFGLWYPTSGDFWLDTYVTDFLSRARAKGYAVPDLAFRNALDNLRNQLNYSTDFEYGGQEIAYALFVLAREGAAAIGDLRYYADEKTDAFATPLAAAQLGAALASYGDQSRADRMFRKADEMLQALDVREAEQYWRADYGSNLRDAAAVLTLAIESGTKVIDRDKLAASISGPRRVDMMSTQESVWSLLAANAMLDKSALSDVTINGEAIDGPMVRVVDQATVGGDAMVFRNEGQDKTTLTLTTFGLPTEPEPAEGTGYQIERTWFTVEGEPVDPTTVKAGDRLVVVLTVTPSVSELARLMVNDPLAAGFEIDNPALMQGGSLAAFDWLDLSTSPQNTEFREDRFLAAVDWSGLNTFRLAYVIRAVSPGTYHLPAASVEDMYRPQFRARSEAGSVTITP